MFLRATTRKKDGKVHHYGSVVENREGRYLLRTNLTEHDPALLWQFYIQLTEVEQA